MVHRPKPGCCHTAWVGSELFCWAIVTRRSIPVQAAAPVTFYKALGGLLLDEGIMIIHPEAD